MLWFICKTHSKKDKAEFLEIEQITNCYVFLNIYDLIFIIEKYLLYFL